MLESIQKAKDRVDKAIIRYKRVVAAEQIKCQHRHLEECAYQPGRILATMPPMRICTDCGLTEDGWGPGYIVLKGRAGVVPREDVYAQRCGFFISDEHKGPLIRKEVTIDQLITKGLS